MGSLSASCLSKTLSHSRYCGGSFSFGSIFFFGRRDFSISAIVAEAEITVAVSQ